MKSESIPVVNIIGKGSCVRVEKDNDFDEVESGRGSEAALLEVDLEKEIVDFDFNCPSVRA